MNNSTTSPPAIGSYFQSFFIAGFECSTHRMRTGRRLDLIRSTEHDRFCLTDYQRMVNAGIKTCREGLRWHLIELRAFEYDFSSAMPMLKAARETGVEIIWDLFHFGWPENIDIFTPDFLRRLGGLGDAFTRFLAAEGFDRPLIAPVNEPSFLSWAGGDTAYLNPFRRNMGKELKQQLARAALEAREAILQANTQARLFYIDPVIYVAAHPDHPEDQSECAAYSTSHFEAWDQVAGRLKPELGGFPEALDIIGVNFYPKNEWIHRPHRTLAHDDPLHRPLREILKSVWERYRRPLFISETGAENAARGPWLRYVCDEVAAAHAAGVPVGGICLYPILNHAGWDDDRHCRNALWSYPDFDGNREIEEDLGPVLAEQVERFSHLPHYLPPAPSL